MWVSDVCFANVRFVFCQWGKPCETPSDVWFEGVIHRAGRIGYLFLLDSCSLRSHRWLYHFATPDSRYSLFYGVSKFNFALNEGGGERPTGHKGFNVFIPERLTRFLSASSDYVLFPRPTGTRVLKLARKFWLFPRPKGSRVLES